MDSDAIFFRCCRIHSNQNDNKEKKRLRANPLPGVVNEVGVEESDEEVEDRQLVHLSADLVLKAQIL